MKHRVLAALATASFALGCNADPGAGNSEGSFSPAPLPPQTIPYPTSSSTLTQGSVIPNFTFQGFVDPKTESTKLQTIKLSDFFNPHAGDPTYAPVDPKDDDRLFPIGSPYNPDPTTQTAKPTAILIDIASVWCGPCKLEAKDTLPGRYAKYKPCGGEFLFQLAEGSAPGSPVTQSLLQTWVTAFQVEYPATFDTSGQLFPLYAADSFPDGAIIDTKTMQIVDAISGVPDDTFWSTFEAHLDASCLSGK